jgi:lysophospholipase L1-like esterase
MVAKRVGKASWFALLAIMLGCSVRDRTATPPIAPMAPRVPGPILAYDGSGAARSAEAGQAELNIGQEFTVTRAGVVVRDLGIWDEGKNGLARPHVLTLFALDRLGPGAAATPLEGGSLTVPAGKAAKLEAGFRFVPLAAPLSLAPGNYALVAHGMNGDDPFGSGVMLPLPATGVKHASFVPRQLASAQSPAFPASGGETDDCSVSFHYENGAAPPLRILPLGDSITVGSRGTNAGYRAMLAAMLTRAGVSFQFVGSKHHNPGQLPLEQTHHEGWTGRVIRAGPPKREGVTEIVRPLLAPGGLRPDIILLLIGTNDVHVDYKLDGAEQRLDALVSLLVDKRTGLARGARLLLSQIPPNGVPAKNEHVQAYNESVEAVARRQRAAGNDVQLVLTRVELSDMAPDKLHPLDSGYRKIAEAWFEALGFKP